MDLVDLVTRPLTGLWPRDSHGHVDSEAARWRPGRLVLRHPSFSAIAGVRSSGMGSTRRCWWPERGVGGLETVLALQALAADRVRASRCWRRTATSRTGRWPSPSRSRPAACSASRIAAIAADRGVPLHRDALARVHPDERVRRDAGGRAPGVRRARARARRPAGGGRAGRADVPRPAGRRARRRGRERRCARGDRAGWRSSSPAARRGRCRCTSSRCRPRPPCASRPGRRAHARHAGADAARRLRRGGGRRDRRAARRAGHRAAHRALAAVVDGGRRWMGLEGRRSPVDHVDRAAARWSARAPRGVPVRPARLRARSTQYTRVDRARRRAMRSATSRPAGVKQGGLAAQQADVAATVIAAGAGAPVEPAPYEPRAARHAAHGRRAALSAPRARAPADEVARARCCGGRPAKIVGRHLAPYLAAARELAHAEPAAR